MATDEEIRAVLIAAGIDPNGPATAEATPPESPPAAEADPGDFRTATADAFRDALARYGLRARTTR